jgi:hypothetical protein
VVACGRRDITCTERPWTPPHGEAATAAAREMVEKMSRTGKGCRHLAADYRRHRHAGHAVDRRAALKGSSLRHVFQWRQLRQQLDHHANDLIRLRRPMSAPIGLFADEQDLDPFAPEDHWTVVAAGQRKQSPRPRRRIRRRTKHLPEEAPSLSQFLTVLIQ